MWMGANKEMIEVAWSLRFPSSREWREDYLAEEFLLFSQQIKVSETFNRHLDYSFH